jgi:hypothetical protein
MDTGVHSGVTVGTVTQTCNKKAGYKLVVSSANCASDGGAKLVGSGDPAEVVQYTVAFDNPTDGGSTDTSGLLGSTCSEGGSPTTTHTLARAVADYKPSNQDSTVAVSYEVGATIGAGTYTDTLTITMTVN